MGLVHVIQEASIIQSERIPSNEMKVRDKDSMIVVDDNSIDSIQLNLCDSIDIIYETDTPDPYLSSVCAIVKRIILSEVQKRDLDLISSIIIYTFNTKGINTNGAKKNDMKEREKDNSRSGSSSRVRISSADGAAGNEIDFNHKLSPLAFLRVYLFRLVFSMYDESINKIIQKVTATSGKEREKDSDFKKVWKFILSASFLSLPYKKHIFYYSNHILLD